MEDAGIDACVKSIKTKLPQMTSRPSSTVNIPRVPERVRLGDNDAYEPRIISFGPYHHGKQSLQAMEKHKWSYLQAILYRNREKTLEQYVRMIKKWEDDAKSCYSDSFEMDNKDFVEMMLLDGCFIVEYLLRFRGNIEDELSRMVWAEDLIRYDLLLLENQIPFFIVSSIFDLAISASSSMHAHSYPSSITNLAILYLIRNTEEKVNLPPPESVHHLLHLYHSVRLYSIEGMGEGSSSSIAISGGDENDEENLFSSTDNIESGLNTSEEEYSDITIPGATVLAEAGIKFMRKEVKGSSLDVTFRNGKMMIPPLLIDSSTKSLFRNLIAFEQFYPNFDKKFSKSFSAYVEFMDCIVNTPEDIALLYEKGIIRHFLGSDKDVADLFNHLNRGTVVKSNHYLVRLYKDVDTYRQKRRHEWRASLVHNYFNSPWAVVSLVAGVILLILTFLQTYFSALSVYRDPPQPGK